MSFIVKVTTFVCGTLIATFASAQDLTIRLGHVTQTSHPFHIGAEMYESAVEKMSSGRIDVQIFPARQLGDDKQLLEGIQLGTVDAAIISSAIFGGATPLMDALQLPFLIEDYNQLADAYSSPEGEALLVGLDEIGIKGLGYYEGGQRHFLSNREGVSTLEDFKGLKTRVVPAKLHLDIWEAIGVNPTPVAYGEVYSSLQTGVLDASEINVSSIEGEKLYEVADQLVLTGQYFWPGVLVVNPAFFEGLSEEDRRVLVDAAKSTIRAQVEAAAEQDDTAVQILKSAGVTVTDFANKDDLRAAVKSVSEAYEAKDPRIKAFADSVR